MSVIKRVWACGHLLFRSMGVCCFAVLFLGILVSYRGDLEDFSWDLIYTEFKVTEF